MPCLIQYNTLEGEKMAFYYFYEMSSPDSRGPLTPLDAKTLDSAKREAARLQRFRGTVLVISDKRGRRAMRSRAGVWEDMPNPN